MNTMISINMSDSTYKNTITQVVKAIYGELEVKDVVM
jgi:hypothetical protein